MSDTEIDYPRTENGHLGYISLIFGELMHSRCSFDSSRILFLPVLGQFANR